MWRDMSSEVITGGRLILVYFNARLGCPALNMVKISFERGKKVKREIYFPKMTNLETKERLE